MMAWDLIRNNNYQYKHWPQLAMLSMCDKITVMVKLRCSFDKFYPFNTFALIFFILQENRNITLMQRNILITKCIISPFTFSTFKKISYQLFVCFSSTSNDAIQNIQNWIAIARYFCLSTNHTYCDSKQSKALEWAQPSTKCWWY